MDHDNTKERSKDQRSLKSSDFFFKLSVSSWYKTNASTDGGKHPLSLLMATWVSFTNGLNNYCALVFISHLNDPIYVLEENMVWVLFYLTQSKCKDKNKSHKRYQKDAE